MKHTLIKAMPGKPAEIILASKSLDRVVATVTAEVTAAATALAKHGYRLDFTDSSKRSPYLGTIFVESDNRKGKAFAESFEAQFAEIRFKFVTRLYEGKAKALFVNAGGGLSTGEFVSYTVISK